MIRFKVLRDGENILDCAGGLKLRILLRGKEWGQSRRKVNIMMKAEGENTM